MKSDCLNEKQESENGLFRCITSSSLLGRLSDLQFKAPTFQDAVDNQLVGIVEDVIAVVGDENQDQIIYNAVVSILLYMSNEIIDHQFASNELNSLKIVALKIFCHILHNNNVDIKKSMPSASLIIYDILFYNLTQIMIYVNGTIVDYQFFTLKLTIKIVETFYEMMPGQLYVIFMKLNLRRLF